MTTPAADTKNLLRVEKGEAAPEELAAITAILLARAAARPAEVSAAHGRTAAGWRRLERTPGFRAPHSWQG
ncbi:acyl-CoA carboxylase subunit epsilon [Streptomyces sp. NBC_00237]|uniref:acyl-CoA carboxylase subunit epsilon n=1 Tax=Streptomyces sp. NBC_00237 TaxID=2975687 RepID=UPI0022509F2C|nr:acyl-CoA carboxylase subunit epsilon [Streptomyces sp. NBC_00237]MCX5203993.1 acyl-CoA carboxylase subunit epsilon [Streptomyces sp. NBC_00237]